jgi:hypothetical protein
LELNLDRCHSLLHHDLQVSLKKIEPIINKVRLQLVRLSSIYHPHKLLNNLNINNVYLRILNRPTYALRLLLKQHLVPAMRDSKC